LEVRARRHGSCMHGGSFELRAILKD